MEKRERSGWWRIAVATGLAGLMGLAGCASTEMTSTWADPSAKGVGLSKIAVVSMSKDPGTRRIVEDEMAQELSKKVRTAQVVPSYQALGGIDLSNREQVKAALKAQGFDGVLVNRLTGVQEIVVADGPYGTFDGYYDYAYNMAYAPLVTTETVVRVMSNLYALNQNRLIWSGASKTFDPGSTKEAAKDVAEAVAKSLQKDRIVL